MVSLVTGNDGSNTLLGASGQDLIYGFDPDGPQGQVTSILATRVATGLTKPLFATAIPGDADHLLIVEQTGVIKTLDLATGQLSPTPFLNLTGQIATNGEQGLLGLAFDPGYATNGRFYVNVINTNNDTEIRRYQVSAGDPLQADARSGTTLITIDQPSNTDSHRAGWLGFGPDGFLYAALGDGNGNVGGDPDGNGQNIDSLLGKILRLDVSSDAFPSDPTRNYAIPSDNPFVGSAGADEIFALGLRNPWRPSFDRGLQDFYIADVGQSTWEEINIGQLGANYGWNVYEGPAPFQAGPLGGGTLTFPVAAYGRSTMSSITGGYVYRGQSEGLQGHYFFADFISGRMFTLHNNASGWVTTERTSQISVDFGAINNPSSFGEDARGNLYVVDYDGDVFRLTPVVTSADQADSLNGLGGDDTLYGGSGNDVLQGGAGNDVLYGQAGIDVASYVAAAAGVTVDLSQGTASDDGQGGHDVLYSVENLIGSAFDDDLVGDGGDNTITGSAGADLLIGGAGVDTLDYSASPIGVVIDLGTHYALGGDATGDFQTEFEDILGSAFADALYGDAGANRLDGGAGNDTISGGNGGDVLIGGDGTDTLDYRTSPSGVIIDLATHYATGGDAIGDYQTEFENVVGSAFNDHLVGNEVNNTSSGGGGGDTLIGGAGIDTLDYGGSQSGVIIDLGTHYAQGGDASGDFQTEFENVIGSAFADTLYGSSGANTLNAGLGNDVVAGGGGADLLIGGLDVDLLDYSASPSGIIIDLGNHYALGGDATGDYQTEFENVIGSAFADTFYGDSGANAVTGGAGSDTFAFNSFSGAVDTIADFASGTDFLQVSASGFGGGLTAGGSVTVVLAASAAAATSGGNGYFILYNSGANIGTLYWDPTGGSGTDATAFAVLNDVTSLTASDFHVV